MQLCKVQWETGEIRVGAVADGHVRFLDLEDFVGMRSLSDVLHSDNPSAVARDLIDENARTWSLKDLTLLAPVDRQEVWAAGVTYKRSREARERESEGAARFYDLVYSADRPELFFKATAERVVGPGARVRIRRDSRWSVPEPELALVLSPHLKIVGYTVGNDMSARDIEGENPLYLPQAKVYDHSCALGPVITLADGMPPLDRVTIRLTIERRGERVFDGSTRLTEMARALDDLVRWLGRDNSFPHGAVLLTGTGVVPPDDFALAAGDVVAIDVAGIGKLTNLVEQGA
jgi:2-dehydro-3-deoxy-D-arabinonate dehydratase